jgi:hypothetical protein
MHVIVTGTVEEGLPGSPLMRKNPINLATMPLVVATMLSSHVGRISRKPHVLAVF